MNRYAPRSGGGQMIFVIGRTYFLVIRDLKGPVKKPPLNRTGSLHRDLALP